MLFATYNHWMVGDKFERLAPSLVCMAEALCSVHWYLILFSPSYSYSPFSPFLSFSHSPCSSLAFSVFFSLLPIFSPSFLFVSPLHTFNFVRPSYCFSRFSLGTRQMRQSRPQNHGSFALSDLSLPAGVLLHAHVPDDRRVPDPAEGEGGEAEPEEAGRRRRERQGGRRRRRGRQLPQRGGDSASPDSGGREQSEERGLKAPAGCYC